MSGTKAGALKARNLNLSRDKDYYVKLGKKGGSGFRPHSRPFHMNRELASWAGRKGGLKSRRRQPEGA